MLVKGGIRLTQYAIVVLRHHDISRRVSNFGQKPITLISFDCASVHLVGGRPMLRLPTCVDCTYKLLYYSIRSSFACGHLEI